MAHFIDVAQKRGFMAAVREEKKAMAFSALVATSPMMTGCDFSANGDVDINIGKECPSGWIDVDAKRIVCNGDKKTLIVPIHLQGNGDDATVVVRANGASAIYNVGEGEQKTVPFEVDVTGDNIVWLDVDCKQSTLGIDGANKDEEIASGDIAVGSSCDGTDGNEGGYETGRFSDGTILEKQGDGYSVKKATALFRCDGDCIGERYTLRVSAHENYTMNVPQGAGFKITPGSTWIRPDPNKLNERQVEIIVNDDEINVSSHQNLLQGKGLPTPDAITFELIKGDVTEAFVVTNFDN